MKSEYIYGFEKLDIWQIALDLSVGIYKLTKGFPPEEKFGLTSQLRRASNSISANIAEGVTRPTIKEKARFIQISYGSAVEVLSHLILSHRLGFIDLNSLEEYKSKIAELTNKINSFHKYLQSNKK